MSTLQDILCCLDVAALLTSWMRDLAYLYDGTHYGRVTSQQMAWPPEEDIVWRYFCSPFMHSNASARLRILSCTSRTTKADCKHMRTYLMLMMLLRHQEWGLPCRYAAQPWQQLFNTTSDCSMRRVPGSANHSKHD